MKTFVTLATLALIGAQQVFELDQVSVPGFTRDFNQCRNSPSLSDTEGVDTWEGLQFQGVVTDFETCAQKCEARDDCNAFEFYHDKYECSLGIGTVWKGLDIHAPNVGCYLKNREESVVVIDQETQTDVTGPCKKPKIQCRSSTGSIMCCLKCTASGKCSNTDSKTPFKNYLGFFKNSVKKEKSVVADKETKIDVTGPCKKPKIQCRTPTGSIMCCLKCTATGKCANADLKNPFADFKKMPAKTEVTGPCPKPKVQCKADKKCCLKCSAAGKCSSGFLRSKMTFEEFMAMPAKEEKCPAGEKACMASGKHQCCYKGENCVPNVGCVCKFAGAKFRQCNAEERQVTKYFADWKW